MICAAEDCEALVTAVCIIGNVHMPLCDRCTYIAAQRGERIRKLERA